MTCFSVYTGRGYPHGGRVRVQRVCLVQRVRVPHGQRQDQRAHGGLPLRLGQAGRRTRMPGEEIIIIIIILGLFLNSAGLSAVRIAAQTRSYLAF